MSSSYLIRPSAAAHFDAAKATKADLTRGAQLFLGLNCFEAGQSQHVHAHAGADKFYFVLSGKATMQVGEDRFAVEAGDLVWAPADVPHGVLQADERTVMLVGLAPPPAAKPR
jgi:quercetin dioxygenase-like cupin family protein